MFDIDSMEQQELKNAICQAVEEGIAAAVHAGMTAAEVTVKIRIQLENEADGAGKPVLVPYYHYKAGIKLGANYEAAKGKTAGVTGLWRDETGYWHEKLIEQQLTM